MRLTRVLSLADFDQAAKRRLPRSLYGYAAGGAENESSLEENRRSFERYSFVPRVLVGVGERTQSTRLFGIEYAAPFGAAPMGVLALCAHDGDRAIATACREEGVPFILSAASTTRLEEVAVANPGLWFQAYLPARQEVIEPMLARLENAKVSTLVLTVDVPVASQREMELRNGFSVPLRLSPALVADALRRPTWLLSTFARTLLAGGVPRFVNFTAQPGARVISAAGNHRADRASFCWEHVQWIRERWRGRLVVKGILHRDDAVRAAQAGCDGIIVSNHGGRQLDGAVAPLEVLPEIVASVPGMTVMIDGGIRRGNDVLKALALGASCVFIGRPLLYGTAVGGMRGAQHVLQILRREVDVNLALLGCGSVAALGPEHLRRTGYQRQHAPHAPYSADASAI